jgi:hypothetical protein
MVRATTAKKKKKITGSAALSRRRWRRRWRRSWYPNFPLFPSKTLVRTTPGKLPLPTFTLRTTPRVKRPPPNPQSRFTQYLSIHEVEEDVERDGGRPPYRMTVVRVQHIAAEDFAVKVKEARGRKAVLDNEAEPEINLGSRESGDSGAA